MRIEVNERKVAETNLTLRNRELETLLNLTRILGRSGDYRDKCQAVLEDLAKLAQADLATLRVFDEDEQNFNLVAASGDTSLLGPVPMPADQYLPAVAIQQRTPLVTNDYASSPRPDPLVIEHGGRSVVCLPIKIGDTRPMGTVNVVSRQPGHFTPELVALLTAITDGFGVLLDNARLGQSLEANREEMAAVDRVARILTSTLNLDEVYEQFTSEVNSLIDFHRAALDLIDEQKGTMNVSNLSGYTSSFFQRGHSYPLEGTFSGHVARTR